MTGWRINFTHSSGPMGTPFIFLHYPLDERVFLLNIWDSLIIHDIRTLSMSYSLQQWMMMGRKGLFSKL